jgi:nucleotide-binding universal stress UspA family protein
MFESLLVPVDDSPESERILPVAAAVALAAGAGIELLTVDSPNVDVGTTSLYHDRLGEALPAGIPTTGTVSTGDGPVAELLLDVYRARPASLLALATRAPGTLWQWLGGGSVGDDVVHEALRPVLLTGPQCDAEAAADIIAAPATAALDGTAVDEQVMDAAIDWCRQLGVGLTLVRAVTNPAEPSTHAGAAADLELRAAEVRARHVEVRTKVVDAGDPGRAVLRAVSASGGILVVGSHRRGPLGRILQGSNALWLVHKSPVPVLVAGFSLATTTADAASADPVAGERRVALAVPSTAAELLGWSELGSIAV